MLCQRHGRFETGPMRTPSGKVLCSRFILKILILFSRHCLQRIGHLLGPRDVWAQNGRRKSGQREVFVQDPDGYLLMLAHSIGERILIDDRAGPPKKRNP